MKAHFEKLDKKRLFVISLTVRVLAASMLWNFWEQVQEDGVKALMRGFYLGTWAAIAFNGTFGILAVLGVLLPIRISSKVLVSRFWFGMFLLPILIYVSDEVAVLWGSEKFDWKRMFILAIGIPCTALMIRVHSQIRKRLNL